MQSIAHPIPQGTPPARLRELALRYLDPEVPIPARYRRTMLARIVALLVTAAVVAKRVRAVR